MQRTWMPTVAGLLNIIAGAIGILGGLIIIILIGTLTASPFLPEMRRQFFATTAAWVFFVPYFLVDILAIAGGLLATRRRGWGMALAGAIFAILSLWGWLLGIGSIVFLVLSKREFVRANIAIKKLTKRANDR